MATHLQRSIWLFLSLFAAVNAWILPRPVTASQRGQDDNKLTTTITTSSRRTVLVGIAVSLSVGVPFGPLASPSYAIPTMDVNNAMAREYTAFPGLYPTVATKIVNAVKDEPFTSKKDVYAILNEVEQERLRQYDKAISINKPDKALQQFKTSQICKYECGSRASSAYRDEQIKSVQAARTN